MISKIKVPKYCRAAGWCGRSSGGGAARGVVEWATARACVAVCWRRATQSISGPLSEE